MSLNKYRKCAVCKQYKLRKYYYNCSAKLDGISYRCKYCDDLARAMWAKNNPEKARESSKFRSIKNRFGLTKEQYNKMLVKQNYKCKICLTDNPKTYNNISFCIDHCHKTNKVRSLLCSRCNRCLGFLKEDIQLLKNMIQYIKYFNKRNNTGGQNGSK